jgi:hypothetical protein
MALVRGLQILRSDFRTCQNFQTSERKVLKLLHVIIIVSLWLCFPGLTFAEAAPTNRSDDILSVIIKNTGSTHPSVIYFSQKEEKKTPDNGIVDETVKVDEDAIKPKTVSKDKNAPKKSKQLKPFVPSETVPADQGVDFPYDI